MNNKTIIGLKPFWFQADYLYDKGENDELFYVSRCSQPIYKYILSCFIKKVKKFFNNFF